MNMMALNEFLTTDNLEPSQYIYISDPLTLPESQGYILLEQYCTNLHCDCFAAVVQFLLIDESKRVISYTPALVVRYNWVKKKLNIEKSGTDPDPRIAKLLFSRYNDLSKDPTYIARLNEHYQRVRELANKSQKTFTRGDSHKISRNALCDCGSGMKYKKCCLNKAENT